MKVMALIPARKESRRLPGKNWRCIGGKPLWQHAVDHAKDSGVCDLIVISTDDMRLFHYDHGCLTIEQPQFVQTYNVMDEVVRHADAALLEMGHDADAICLLQPTSPLRTGEDVANCVRIFTEFVGVQAVDSVVSVTDAEDDVVFEQGHAGRLRKLKHTGTLLKPNGAIFLIKTSALRAGEHWYGDFAYCYKMPKDQSIDIDNELDLEMAQLAWGRLYGSQ